MTSLISRWREASLSAQFALAGGVVMLIAMLVVGQWVALRIEETVVRNWANATALYMESFISPLSQDLAASDELSPLAHRALDEVFEATSLGDRVVSYKIWKANGLIVDASDHSLVGQRFQVDGHLRQAWSGQVAAELSTLDAEENVGEAALGMRLLEIYSPVREVWSGRVIGVIEFYERADGLLEDIAQAQRRSWATVAAVFGGIGLALWGIVARGSAVIARQRAELERQVLALEDLSAHNEALRLRVQGAAARVAAAQDQALRQVGADLHDGPAQLMAYAALRLDGLPVAEGGESRLDEVLRAVKDAIREIRSILRGVALPDIAARCPCAIVTGLAEAQAARAGLPVAVECDAAALPELGEAQKICLYRFVQEGLNNAWRHGEGRGMAVALRPAPETGLEVTVRDGGPGFPAAGRSNPDGLGLAGLRDRIEALGGTLDLRAAPDGGAELRRTLPVVPT